MYWYSFTKAIISMAIGLSMRFEPTLQSRDHFTLHFGEGEIHA